MKLATFEEGGTIRVGLVVGAGVVDVARHVPTAPSDMVDLMGVFGSLRAALEKLATREPDHALGDVILHAPVRRAGKIWGIGLNYADHIRESGREMPTQQMWFAKAVTSVQAPYGAIELPKVSDELDYEAELAFVIGKRCKHVTAADAPGVIFGFCVANDVSVRDWQRATTQHTIGKSFDTHAPIGPWITTSDEVANPHALDIRCLVNGEERQSSNTRELIFDCFRQVQHLSSAMTLEPGDIFLSGTPGGVGTAMKPPRYLKEGDLVRVEIQGLGAIENRVRRED